MHGWNISDKSGELCNETFFMKEFVNYVLPHFVPNLIQIYVEPEVFVMMMLCHCVSLMCLSIVIYVMSTALTPPLAVLVRKKAANIVTRLLDQLSHDVMCQVVV